MLIMSYINDSNHDLYNVDHDSYVVYHDVADFNIDSNDVSVWFRFQKGVPSPPSLVNMYKELSTDIPGFEKPTHGFLEGWAKQVWFKGHFFR